MAGDGVGTPVGATRAGDVSDLVVDLEELRLARERFCANDETGTRYLTALRRYRLWLEDLAAADPAALTVPESVLVVAYVSDLQRQNKAASTIDVAVAAVRWWALRTGRADPTSATADMRRAARRERQVAAIAGELDLDELTALVEATGSVPWPGPASGTAGRALGRAMVLAGVHLAGRYSDLARLRVCDVERTDEGFKVTPWVRKNWPGGTPDGLWLVRTENAQFDPVAAMDEWLVVRSELGPGWLFPAWRAGGWVVDEPVSYDHYSSYLAALGATAGVGQVTSHTLRRSTTQLLWDQGANEAELMRLLGHRDTRTLNRYLRKERSAGAGGQIVERYADRGAGNA